MKKYIWFFFFCLPAYFISCSEEEKQAGIPPEIVPKEKMTLLIADIHLAEAQKTLYGFSDSLSITPVGFDSILANHNVSREEYEKSILFYTEYYEILNEIYEQAISELSKRQSEAENTTR